MTAAGAKIVFVDDQPDTLRSLRRTLESDGFTVILEHPHELRSDQLEDATLVLVDFFLEDRFWPERADLPYVAQIQDGLALAGSLRARLRRGEGVLPRPTGIALHSARLDMLSREMPTEIREYALARVHGLEWVFPKAGRGERSSLRERVGILAHAMQAVPASWPVDAQVNARDLGDFLALPANPETLGAAAWADVLDSHPPLHELSTASRGLTIMRWLAQRVLPYPCFLLDECQVALKLRVEPETLAELLVSPNDPLARMLGETEYRGALAGFIGRRWWRAGIDHLLWTVTEGALVDRALLAETLSNVSGLKLRFLQVANPVAVVDETYRGSGFAPAADCVRLVLDDWPPFATDPWTTIAAALADDALAARVHPSDRDRLVSE